MNQASLTKTVNDLCYSVSKRGAAYRQIQEADMVIGVDIANPRNASVFYGRKLLNHIVLTNCAENCRTLFVPVSFAEDYEDVEALAAACRVVKGADEYDGTSFDPTLLITPHSGN